MPPRAEMVRRWATAFQRWTGARGTARVRSRPQAAWFGLVFVGLVLSPNPAIAGAWVVPHGHVWTKQSFSYWRTTERFASTDDRLLNFPDRGPVQAGDAIPFDPTTGGRFEALSYTLEAQFGVFDGVQVGARLPLLFADFDETNSADTVDSSFGVGDLWLTAQGALPTWDRYRFAGRVDVKLPVGEFDPSIFAAPLTEGQIDVNLAGLMGVSLHPYGYANLEAGWRIRLENASNRRDPGDEFRFAAELGAFLPWRLLAKVVVDGVVGFEGEDRFARPTTTLPRRRLYSAWLGLLWTPVEDWTLEADIRFLLAGEDFPTGRQYWVGVSYEFDALGE